MTIARWEIPFSGMSAARISEIRRVTSAGEPMSALMTFVPVEDHFHGDDVERGIPAKSPQRDARVHVDVALADFEESAGLGEAGKPHRDGLCGERVEDDIRATAVGEFHHGLGEIATAGIDDVLDAERFQQRTLGRATSGCDDIMVDCLGEPVLVD
jgi:hypothetical protein